MPAARAVLRVLSHLTLPLALLGGCTGLAAQGTPAGAAPSTAFDGDWRVVMTCPPHADARDDAKGYTKRFKGTVAQGRLQVASAQAGDEPGSVQLSGPIEADGTALLLFEGVVSNPDYALHNSPRGKPFQFKVKARFSGDEGQGERLTGRVCRFEFKRQKG